jgi:SAM-dependent methyltransferase
MSEVDHAVAGAGKGRSAKEWEQHWDAFDDATRLGPAPAYRRGLIFAALGRAAAPTRLLDLGCGQGDFLQAAGAQFPQAELVGVDLSEVGLASAQKKVPRARLVQADFSNESPLPEWLTGSVSHMVCAEVVEHLDQPAPFLRKAATLLAPGGELIITVPGGPRSAFDLQIGHRRHYSPAELGALAAEAGLSPVRLVGAGFPFFNLYRLVVVARGERLSEDIRGAQPTLVARTAMRAFGLLFRANSDRTALGWQTFGVFRKGAG